MEQRLQTTITFSMHFREPSEINRVPIKFRSYSQSLFSPTYHTERVVFLMTKMTLTSHLRTSNVKKILSFNRPGKPKYLSIWKDYSRAQFEKQNSS